MELSTRTKTTNNKNKNTNMEILILLYILYLLVYYWDLELALFSPTDFYAIFICFIMAMCFGGFCILESSDIVNSVVFFNI
jgi:hypothetical protein